VDARCGPPPPTRSPRAANPMHRDRLRRVNLPRQEQPAAQAGSLVIFLVTQRFGWPSTAWQSAKGRVDPPAHRGLRTRDEKSPLIPSAASRPRCCLPPHALDHRRPVAASSRCPCAAAHPGPRPHPGSPVGRQCPCPGGEHGRKWLVVAITDGRGKRAPSRRSLGQPAPGRARKPVEPPKKR